MKRLATLLAVTMLTLAIMLSSCAGASTDSGSSSNSSAPSEPNQARDISSADVVQAFRDNGLQVDPVMNVDDAPSWKQFVGPKTYREGTRFVIIPGDAQGRGEESGQVLKFDSQDDLQVMKRYWETLNENTTGMLHSWVYTKDNMILHIGNVPKSTADAYDKVFESVA